MTKLKALTVILGLLLAFTLVGCDHGHDHNDGHSHSHETDKEDSKKHESID